jgi:hypothetical protein
MAISNQQSFDGNEGLLFPVAMSDNNNIQGSASVHTLISCRVGAFKLATCIASGVPNASSKGITFNATYDGFSIAGMIFAKLNTLHAKHMSGEIGKVRL